MYTCLGGSELALDAIDAHQVNVLVVVPTMLKALLDAAASYDSTSSSPPPPSSPLKGDGHHHVHWKEGRRRGKKGRALSSIRFVLVGGQSITPPLWIR